MSTRIKSKGAVEAVEAISTKENPCLFQVNTRVWLTELSKQLRRPATLDDVPDQFLDELAQKGFDWAYFLSVWQTGSAGREVSRTNPGWREGYKADLPDVSDADICGSGFAITDYQLNTEFGKPDSLLRLKERLNKRGIKLMLDLVPNHTGLDHWWVTKHPEYYVGGDETALANAPQNYIKVGNRIFAHGRDPYFDGWPDTLQLNYGSDAFRKAMLGELEKIAQVCDGLRCDMAMLVLPDVFGRTWGIEIEEFWPGATEAIKAKHPDFVFMAEVYWDREWELQQQGFDFTYDKKLYDRLRQGNAGAVREHFWASTEYQMHSARFLENHDEPRAAGIFSNEQHKAAAVITFLCPGLRFFHQGQFEGWRKRVSVHLNRRTEEPLDNELKEFYGKLIECLQLPVVHGGNWRLLEVAPGWDGNWTWSSFLTFLWTDNAGSQLLVVVNYSGHQSQCHVILPTDEISEEFLELKDVLGTDVYRRNTAELERQGLFIDLPAWGYNAFALAGKPN